MPLTSTPASPSRNTRCALTRSEELELLGRMLKREAQAWVDFQVAYGRLIDGSIAGVISRFRRRGCSEDAAEIRATLGLELLSGDCAKLRAFSADRGIRLGTWISMLASHAAYDFLRRRRREPLVDGEVDPDRSVGQLPQPDAMCELGERARMVSSLVRTFTAKDREFLDLYFTEGLPADVVASRMGISVNTVYSKKHKIQGRLESLLTERRLAA